MLTNPTTTTGVIASAGYLAAAPLGLAEPKTRVRQFEIVYKRGAASAPFLGLGTSASFLWLAYKSMYYSSFSFRR